MSPTHTISPEWMNENVLRAYPLEDDSPAAAALPAWLVADIRVTCPTEYPLVYISSAYLSDTLVSIAVSGHTGTQGAAPVGLLARTVTRDELEPFRTYSMDRMSAGASGTVAFGEIPPGTAPFRMTFSENEARIVEAAIVRTRAPGVTKIVDPYHGVEATGIIDLSGNSEFRTSVDPSDPHTIVFTLSDICRDTATSVCDATPSRDACGATPVRTINGVAPTTETTEIGGVEYPAGTIILRFR
jgi:hypothetical protein